MKKIFLALAIALLLGFGSQGNAQEVFGYKVTPDVIYGEGKVKQGGKVSIKKLRMDIYTPTNVEKNEALPAVVLVHGGAWHRGGRRFPPYEQFGGVHSMMEGYARLLTPIGYVCFVIDYRLVPDNPIPAMEPDAEGLQNHELILTDEGLDRLSLVRGEMGLPLLTKEDSLVLWNGILAGAEDVKLAVDHVKASANKYGIDPERVALGGHSAGAGNTLNAAYGLQADVAAIFPLSPAVLGFNMEQILESGNFPPMLLMTSQNDLGAVLETTPDLLKSVRKAGITHEFSWVPGFAHFYPTEAVALGSDGVRMSVGQRVAEFLDKYLAKPSPEMSKMAGTDNDFISLTQEEGKELAKERKLKFRVIEIDGQSFPVTMDYRKDRINATIKEGKIVKVNRG